MTRSNALNAELGRLESVAPTGQILRLVLEQAADRVSHRIEILDAAAHVLAELRSAEGTGSDDWPPSPTLQSCSLQEIRPGERAAFLVGMAGKSHWSACIEPIPGQGAIVFDFACRVHQTPKWLGTTYSTHALAGVEVPRALRFEMLPSAAIVSLGRIALSFRAERTSDAALPVIKPIHDGGLQVVHCIASPVLRATTFRWRYCLSIDQAQ